MDEGKILNYQVYFGADHGGWQLKNKLLAWLQTQPISGKNFACHDFGAYQFDLGDDYPEFGLEVARALARARATNTSDQDPTVWGILLCRSGSGMAIVANRFKNVRAVVCRSLADVQHDREHNNANVLVLEADHLDENKAREITKAFFQPYGIEESDKLRHRRRLAMFNELGESVKN